MLAAQLLVQPITADQSRGNFSGSSGFVQGSCLAPIFFNIFINPLLKKFKGAASAYADDIKNADNTVISTNEQIPQDPNIIDDWLETMLMLFVNC